MRLVLFRIQTIVKIGATATHSSEPPLHVISKPGGVERLPRLLRIKPEIKFD
jgi:hypothetical protein